MKHIVFSFPGNEILTQQINSSIHSEKGEFILRKFPDEETYIRIQSNVKHKHVIIACSLHQPDSKILSLLFFCRLLRDMDATSISLVSPYLPYMRQDKQFNPGEAITSQYFSQLLSPYIDQLITVDPHLHRTLFLHDLYTTNCITLHAGKLIARWVSENIEHPLFIGPDSESQQWVSNVALSINAPYLVLNKIRKGDRTVEISIPKIKNYMKYTPVIIDDIISTAKTMIATVNHLNEAGTKLPVCIGIHAVFANNAYKELKATGVKQIITCNTITHETNGIDVTGLIVNALKGLDTNHGN
ncbi:MAG: ribose-phosphate diphosphokinase [Bacteroidia bacterium]